MNQENLAKLEKLNQNKAKIVALKNKIKNIESTDEIVNNPVGVQGLKAKKYKTKYPFFKRTAGASGYVDTGSLYCYESLEHKIFGGSNPQYTVIRTLVPRTYTNTSGSIVTTIPNGSSATNAVYNWAQGDKGYTLVAKEYLNNRTIAEGVREQEDYFTQINQTPSYNQADFADLLDCDFLAPPAIEALEILKAELITQFNAELETLSAENVAILADINALKSAAQVALAQSQAALQEKEQALANMEQANATTLAEIQAIQEEIQRLEAEIQQPNNANPEYLQNLQELESLRNQKEILESQITQKEQELESARNEITTLQSEVSDKEQWLESLQTQDSQLQNDLTTLQSQKQGLESQIQATEDSINKNYAKKPTLETEITQLESELANQNALNAELQAQITQLESQKTQLESELANAADPALAAQKTQLESEIAILQNQITQGQGNSTALQSQIAQLESQKAQLENQLTNLADPVLIERINQLNAEIAQLRAQIDKAQYNAKALEARISALKAQNAILKVEHIALALKKQEQTTDLVGNSITHNFLVEKNNALKNTFNAQLAEISTLNENLQTLNEAIARQTRLNLKSLYDSKLMHIEYLFANALLKHTNLNAQILKCIKIIALAHHDRIPELKAKKDAMEAEINRLNDAIIALYAEILELERDINALESSIQNLQEENANLLEEIAALENHREYLQNICKAENEKLKKLKESLEIKKASVNAILERIAIKRELIKKAMQQKIELNNLLYQGIGKIQLLRGRLELINTDLERTQNQIKETQWNIELM